MKLKRIVFILIAALLLLALAFLVWGTKKAPVSYTSQATSTAPELNSVSTGQLEWSYPTAFGLAVTNEQLRGMVKSYIPPCDQTFDYCLYYQGNDFTGTNFESAGIRIKRREDIKSEQLCLTKQPTGYTGLSSISTSTDVYSASLFSPIADAATGHYSNGELYRLYLRQTKSCYEVETRLGQSQIANYPPGTIEPFTDADQQALKADFAIVLQSFKLAASGQSIQLPHGQD